VHETITFLLVSLPSIHRFRKKFTDRLSKEPFLSWLLTTPPHLQYVATLLCNLSLIACFADINVSQGSVATDARCGGIFNIHLTTNLPRNLPLNYFFNRLIFDRIIVVSLWPTFLAYPVYIKTTALHKIRQPTFRFLEAGLKVKGKGSPYSITERRVP